MKNLEARKGVKIAREPAPWCTEATRDNIRHYAHGIGDDNPLWCDPDYAAGSAHGGIVALPSFLFSCSRIISGYVGGLPGVHAMWAGADWMWHKWVRHNDAIATESRLKDFIIRETKFSGRAVQQIYHVDFFNGEGDKVAEGDSWCFRTERDTAREEGTKYDDLKTQEAKTYTPDELTEIYRHYAEEEVRGATPRHVEDVAVGDKLPTMVKGPMTVTGFIAYAQGWGGLYIRANKLAWKTDPRPPGAWHSEPVQHSRLSGTRPLGERVRHRCWRARRLRLWARAVFVDDPPPDQLDGGRRFLLHSETKIRHHNPEGDTLFINGEVTAVDDDVVTVAHEARNQDGSAFDHRHGPRASCLKKARRMSTTGPYAGIKVLDFGQVMAAPYAGMLLADLGADVVKIESPSGDATRNYTPPDVGGESPYYLFVNRNKRGIAIDLKSEDGRAAILAMAKTADVVIENFRAGSMDRLGIGYETLKELQFAIDLRSSFRLRAHTGPFANKAGYDPIAQAESGLMSMCGDPDGPPTRIGISVIDMITGTFATQAISAALYARRDTGAGQYIEANLFATAANMLGKFWGPVLDGRR